MYIFTSALCTIDSISDRRGLYVPNRCRLGSPAIANEEEGEGAHGIVKMSVHRGRHLEEGGEQVLQPLPCHHTE